MIYNEAIDPIRYRNVSFRLSDLLSADSQHDFLQQELAAVVMYPILTCSVTLARSALRFWWTTTVTG
jgi:hypothetical protein